MLHDRVIYQLCITGNDLDATMLDDRVTLQLLTKQARRACIERWIYDVRIKQTIVGLVAIAWIYQVRRVTISAITGKDLEAMMLDDRVNLQLLTKQAPRACIERWIYDVRIKQTIVGLVAIVWIYQVRWVTKCHYWQ